MKRIKCITFWILVAFCIMSFQDPPRIPHEGIDHFKRMFEAVIVQKNPSAIPNYYCKDPNYFSKDFILYSKDKELDYADFMKLAEEISCSPIEFQVEYDEPSIVNSGESKWTCPPNQRLEMHRKSAARLWITTCLPDELPKQYEVMLIVSSIDTKINRLWITHLDWA